MQKTTPCKLVSIIFLLEKLFDKPTAYIFVSSDFISSLTKIAEFAWGYHIQKRTSGFSFCIYVLQAKTNIYWQNYYLRVLDFI